MFNIRTHSPNSKLVTIMAEGHGFYEHYFLLFIRIRALKMFTVLILKIAYIILKKTYVIKVFLLSCNHLEMKNIH